MKQIIILLSICIVLLCSFSLHAGTSESPPVEFQGQAGGDPLDNWVWRNPLPSGNSFAGIAYGNGTFVAVGGDSILTSPEGTTWTRRTIPETYEALYAVVYGKGIFVATGSGGVVLTSPDGTTWTRRTVSGTDEALSAIAYGNGTFVALGDAGLILTSSDGATWIRRTSPVTDTSDLCAITYGGKVFVAVGNKREFPHNTPVILTSEDGATWIKRTPPAWFNNNSLILAVTYGNGTFLATGWGNDDCFLTSPDGITWTKQTPPETYATFRAVGYGNGILLALGDNGTILTSSNGTTWTKETSGLAGSLRGVAYGNNTFVAVGTYGAILTSPEGTTWTSRTSSVTNTTLSDVVYGKGTFLAVGNVASADGVKWTAGSLPKGISALAYGNGTFVAMTSYTGKAYTSPDGTTWSEGTLSATEVKFTAITYGGKGFVGVGYYVGPSYEDARIFTSSDGATWKQVTSFPFYTLDLHFLGIASSSAAYVTVGSLLSAAGISYPFAAASTDGAAWTRKSLPISTGQLNAVTYGNGTFVAVGVAGLDDECAILTSPDGIKWTERTCPVKTAVLNAVTYGDGTFVAVGYNGIILTSPDGIQWTRRASSVTDGVFSSVVYGNSTFVVVGSDAMILQSSPSGPVLTLTKSGTGAGTVTSSPAGISCGSTCSASFTKGLTVTLTATASAGSVFSGWSGCTSALRNTCKVAMTAAKTVTATFTVTSYPLAVSKTGNGSGTVASSPSGISCGSTCSAFFKKGATVTLTATQAAGSTFSGWSGCTSSSGRACRVTMTSAKNVTAAFTVGTYALAISRMGTGKGTVTSSPSGISCGSACSAKYAYGTVVTLTATSATGSTFTGWSGGGCSGAFPLCSVTVKAATAIKALFATAPAGSITIDWSSYLSWTAGRAWQFQTTASEGTHSDYIAGTASKNGYTVIKQGWSANYSDQIDYYYFGPDGVYFVGYYDGDGTKKDLFASPPCPLMPNSVVPGKAYSLTCRIGTATKTVKITYTIVNDITVPYGTFNNALKTTQVSEGVTRINWYAKNVGHIKEYVAKPNKTPRTDNLLRITEGNWTQPPN